MQKRIIYSLGKASAGLLAMALGIALHVGPGYSQDENNSAVFGAVTMSKGQIARLHFVNLNNGPLGSLKANLKFIDFSGTTLTERQWLVTGGEHISLDWSSPSAQKIHAIVTAATEGTEAQLDFFLANIEILLCPNGPTNLVIGPIHSNPGSVEEAKSYADQAAAAAAMADQAARNAEMAAADAKASADKAEAAADRAEAAAAKAEACLLQRS